MSKRLIVLTVLLCALLPRQVLAEGPAKLVYISPQPGARLVTPGTTIALRLDGPIALGAGDSALFHVAGEESGVHGGALVLADDRETLIFKPEQPFALGERVKVVIDRGLRTASGEVFEGLSLTFAISPKEPTSDLSPAQSLPDELGPQAVSPELPAPTVASADPATLPPDLPALTVTTLANGTSGGYLFLSTTNRWRPPYYLMIADDAGQPVYYKRVGSWAMDFKVQPNGLLTYFQGGKFYAMDSSYNIVDTFQPGNGYGAADGHDLQLLPDGHALLIIWDPQPVDMSQIVAGGVPTATVTGVVIQEQDAAKNVVFQWRSWDHFLITDSYDSVTSPRVDWTHTNAVELDCDGNLLISSRNLSEITKIDRKSGDIIWRLGGKNNQFTFINDSPPYFFYQHDIRRLPNGHITLFDNRNSPGNRPDLELLPHYSRAVEYALDERAKTATLVWQYRTTPDTFGSVMGNTQRLSNGNTVIGWGSGERLTEGEPDGSTAVEMKLPAGVNSYRTFRFPWHGYPTTQPALAVQFGNQSTTLIMSWNGATDISAYRIYAGDQPHPTTPIATQPRTGFETRVVLNTPPGVCRYYRVMPLDNNGWETRYSNEVTTCQYRYLPLLAK